MNHFNINDAYAAPDAKPTSAAQVPKRDEIDATFKWKLSDIYASDQDFQEDCEKLKKKLTVIIGYKGKLNQPAALLKCLSFRDEIGCKASALFAYARMHQDTDAKDQKYQAMTSQMETLLAGVASAAAFIEPELLTIPAEELTAMITGTKALHKYKFYIEDLLRQNQHILSPLEEELLAGASELMKVPANIHSTLTNADIKFPETLSESGEKTQLSEGRYNTLIRSTNRAVRKDAFAHLFATYATYRNTFATTLSSNVKNTIFYTKTKKYNSTLEAALENSNVPSHVYTNLIATIHKNLAPLHRYVELKKKFLHLDDIHMYDLYVPLTKEIPAEIPYQEGLDLVAASLKPLGEKYRKDLLAGMERSWVDIYENQGKRTGAYSWGVYGIHPFVLLNYDNRYGAVSTLAHELGHAMHSYYSNKAQDYINASYTIFCAEVASTANEILLLDHMLEIEKDPKKRIYFINQYLEQVRTTVYRQTMFAEFEMIIHAKAEHGEALTADLLEKIWLDLNRKYHGTAIVLDDEIKIEWARIPHFYRPFYVYQYATGYAAATTLANNLLHEGQPAQARYLRYLQSGGSNYSIDLLKAAGVDMTTSRPLEITLEKFKLRLDELENY